MIMKSSKIKARGESMMPLVLPGATIHVNFSCNTFYIGDIVVFLCNKHLVIHRIIHKTRNNQYILMGDNNYTVDGLFSSQYLLGKVVKINNFNQIIDTQSFVQSKMKYAYVLKSRLKLLWSHFKWL